MENQINILGKALDAANKQGVFTLHESATIYQAFQSLAVFVINNSVDKQDPEPVATNEPTKKVK